MSSPHRYLLVLLLTLLVAGCGSPAEDTVATTRVPDSPAATRSPAAPSPTRFVEGELTECFIAETDAGVRPVHLRGAAMDLPGVVFTPPGNAPATRSRTVMVLLHQSDGNGRCGWGPFGTAAALDGVTALAFDQCGYGGAACSTADPDDPLPQVRLALSYARTTLHADRVVLVGASMGGSRTVRAVAAGARVDAWADVSGPSDLDGVVLAPLAARIHTPGLVALAGDTDGTDEATAARALARASGATWVPASGGHGYELLTDAAGGLLPVGRRVLELAR